MIKNRSVVAYVKGGEGAAGRDECWETLGGDGYVYNLDCDGFRCVCICQNLQNCTFSMCSLLYVSYISVRMFKK